MFKLVLAVCLVAAAVADVSHLPVAPIAILRQAASIDPEGNYQYNYETENGIKADEQGQIHATGPETADKNVQGSYSYISPEGEQVSVSYVADANGYQPQGSHIPVPPAIPAAIERALKYIAAHPEPEQVVRRF